MNCKPGDLAYIVHPTMYGKFVNVMYETPSGDYILPDGFPGVEGSAGAWICEAHGAPFDAKLRNSGRIRKARYASIDDKWLRPIRGIGDEDETLTWAGNPNETPADVVRAAERMKS